MARSAVGSALAIGVKGIGLKHSLCAGSFKSGLSVHPSGNGYPALFRAGEG